MTAVATRVPCPVDGCTYAADNGASIPAHVSMAHPDLSIAKATRKRSARNDEAIAETAAPVEGQLPAFAGSGPELREIPLDLVDVGANVRISIEDLDELTASIAEHGVLQPVKVSPAAEGRYLLLWGQRRTLAARQAGLATIPAIVVDAPTEGPQRSVEQLVENLHRADLNPIDRATAMRAVVDSGVSQADLARKLGIAPSTVANDLRILGTAPEVQEALREGAITAAHVKAIASLPTEEQADWTAEIRDEGLSAHDVEQALAERRRQEEWTKQQEADRRKAVDERKVKALAALETRAVAKDAAIRVTGGYGDESTAKSVVGALEHAGYTGVVKGSLDSERLSYQKPAAAFCDCAVWRLEVDSWSANVRLAETCVVQAHVDAEWTAKSSKDSATRTHQDEIRDRVQRLITTSALNLAHESPLAARVLLWIAFDWSLNDWVRDHKGDRKKPNAWDEISSLPEGALAVELAMFVRKGFTDRYNVKLDWERIERELAEALEATS